MTRNFLAIGLAVATLAALPAQADTIRNACMKGERRGDVRLCSCIQQAADRTLTRRDQNLAASFFKDPDKAQKIRQSSSSNHSNFWKRYKNFGATAQAYCS